MPDHASVPFRVIVENAPEDVAFAVQLGRSELLPPRRSGNSLIFAFDLRVKFTPEGTPVFLGPAAQGPPHDRFVYLNSGTSAGQRDSCWTRRAKLKLGTIDRATVDRVLSDRGLVLEGRTPAIGSDGGPVCATTRLFRGWLVAT